MPDELEEHLKSHARSFDSLLSLIPAKLYYGEDVSDQWRRKKQTPEQKRAAKMAKLDPDNWKSAKDVMDERSAAALKRKREEEGEVEEEEDLKIAGIVLEKSKAEQELENPKPKRHEATEQNSRPSTAPDEKEVTERRENKRRRKAEQRAAKKEYKDAKKAKAKEKNERQQARKQAEEKEVFDINKAKPSADVNDVINGPAEYKDATNSIPSRSYQSQPQTSSSISKVEESSAPSSDEEQPEIFSPQHESGTSSISSINAPSSDAIQHSSLTHKTSHPDTSTPPSNDLQTPKERLQAAISNFRAERKADGSDGREPKTRHELLEQRRRKTEERRAAKKAQKRKEREEAARLEDEEIERRFSPGGSGSLLASPRSPLPTDPGTFNFNFSRIAFDDGTQLDPSLTHALSAHRPRKGPSDPASALHLAQSKLSRLAGFDESKRADIEQKDMWLNARKRAHGEKVRDDTSLLKRALKRQQSQKKKSEREWDRRIEGVQQAQEIRLKKRADNIERRKDEKGGGGKKKKVKRPGFEGSFRGRTGGGKKK